jgi:DNA mismatch repair protein MutS2
MPVEIIQNARRMLGEGTQALDALLEDLAKERSTLNRSRIEIETEKKKIDLQKADTDARLQVVIAEERKLKQITHDTVVREAAELQRDIRAATAELRKTRSHDTVEKAKEALASVHQRLQGETWQQPETKIPPVTSETPVEDAPIKPGDTVLLKEANLKATVISISPSSGQVEVQAGRVRMTLSLNGLEKIVVTPGSPKPKFIPITKQVSKPVSLQIDLRGKRAGEIEPELDSYINNASVAGLAEIRIIHGMATGTVRQIVRELLSVHPLVRSFEPGGKGEGGDGATIVKL